jgi:predicted GNAT family acetyltransferase
MVTKLSAKHKNILLDYIYNEKDWNLFMIGDYENYGIETYFQSFWGEFDENNRLIAVLMKYYEGLIFTAINDQYDVDSFVEVINSLNYTILSGKEDIVKNFTSRINFNSVKSTYYAKIDKDTLNLDKEFTNYNIISCSETDSDYIKDVVNLTNSIEEFSVSSDYDRIVNSIKDKSGRVYALFNGNKVVSAAQLTAENSSSGMVMAVCTDKDYRGKGYATYTLCKLCNDLVSSNKILCLFYDNPVAGKIYKRIGFRDIGKWSMLFL